MAITEKSRKKLLAVDDAKKFPAWFRQVLARRLLLILIPQQLSRDLPRWLSLPYFGEIPGAPPDAPPASDINTPPSIPGYDPGSGPVSPIYTPPFTPGPPHPPHPSPGPGEHEISISAAGDEILSSDDSSWVSIHDALDAMYEQLSNAETEPDAYTNNEPDLEEIPYYLIRRVVEKFSTAEIPAGATIVEGSITLTGSDFTSAKLVARKAPDATWENVDDWGEGEGDPTAAVTMLSGEPCIFTLTADQLAYIQGEASVCYFMILEYDHDYLDAPPDPGESFSSSWTRSEDPPGENSPLLWLKYRV